MNVAVAAGKKLDGGNEQEGVCVILFARLSEACSAILSRPAEAIFVPIRQATSQSPAAVKARECLVQLQAKERAAAAMVDDSGQTNYKICVFNLRSRSPSIFERESQQ